MRVKEPQKAVHEAFVICGLIRNIDKGYSSFVNSTYVGEDLSIVGLSVWEKEEYWKSVKGKEGFTRGIQSLMKSVEKFIKSYRVSPILGFNDGVLSVGFEGSTRGFRAGGEMRYQLMDPVWFEGLKFPKPPVTLREAFG